LAEDAPSAVLLLVGLWWDSAEAESRASRSAGTSPGASASGER